MLLFVVCSGFVFFCVFRLRFVILARIDLVSAVVGVFMLLDEVLFILFCVHLFKFVKPNSSNMYGFIWQ